MQYTLSDITDYKYVQFVKIMIIERTILINIIHDNINIISCFGLVAKQNCTNIHYFYVTLYSKLSNIFCSL